MLKKSLLIIVLTLGLSTDVVLTNLVAIAKPGLNASIARTHNKNRTNRSSILGFKIPRNRLSRNREGGVPAGAPCVNDISALLPPRPKNLEVSKAPVEPTLASHPTFFVDIPEKSPEQATFILRDENDEVLLKEDIALKSVNGIVAYTLPKRFKGLEVGKKYIWRFSLLCNSDDLSGNPKISAWITRIVPSTSIFRKLGAAKDDFDRLVIYAENGFWHETLKTLVDLRAAKPNDQIIVESWNNVLKSVDLDYLAKKPVITVTGVPSEW
ncbi:MAG TPA: DUF928 domain-containing protein [Nostocaceae cyanobacterium]|nr:DUF928 domain-containing protein [Nostocaceae cyanobacterium]